MNAPRWKFSQRSRDNLLGVHADLIILAAYALTVSAVDFVVTEGLRSEERQQELVAAGASQTMDSRHLTGHAIDVAALVNGDVRWDWPLYARISEAMADASRRFGIPVEWGGNWTSFKDGPHFQLPRHTHPAPAR